MKLRTNQSFIKDQEQKLKIKRISVEVKIHINKRPMKFYMARANFQGMREKRRKKKASHATNHATNTILKG
jgi:hypothetical protein